MTRLPLETDESLAPRQPGGTPVPRRRDGWVRRGMRALERAVDHLFGYDVFVAYRRVDGAEYAIALVERLEREKLTCFIDVREYGAGDDLPSATTRHIGKATMLVVVGSPGLIDEKREPDWVLREIETYITAHVDDARRLLPIDFGGVLAAAEGNSPIAARLCDSIRIFQPLEALHAPPADAVVGAITKQFHKGRRDRVRLRVFLSAAAAIALLVVLAGGVGLLARSESRKARRNLSQEYLTAAAARLESGERDHAAALAAESLRHYDTPTARRIIAENPPLDLGRVVALRAESVFALDVDPIRNRTVLVGYQGMAVLQSLDPADAARSARISPFDLMSVAFSPDGSRLLMGDDSGRVHVRSTQDLRRPLCPGLPRLDGGVSGFRFASGGRVLVVLAARTLYATNYQGGCPTGTFRTLFTSDEYVQDFVVDEANGRLVVALPDELVAVSLSGAPGAFTVHPLPTPAGSPNAPHPERIALQPGTGNLCVFTLGGEELVFLDRDFRVVEPRGVRPFGAREAPNNVRVFAFDATGNRLVIMDQDGHTTIWSLAERSAERRLRVHETLVHAGVFAGDALWTAGQDSSAGAYQQTIRHVHLAPPSRAEVAGGLLPPGDEVVGMEEVPAGGTVLLGTGTGLVLSLDLATRALTRLADEESRVMWASTSPRGETAHFEEGAVVTVTRARVVRRRDSLLAHSPTGLRSAAWLNDGSGLVIGGGWSYPVLLPVDDPRARVFLPASLTVEGVIAAPEGRVILRLDGAAVLWNTRAKTSSPIKLLPTDSAALMDVEPWGRGGVAALTRSSLFLRRWTRAGTLGAARRLPIGGDQLAVSADGRRIVVFRRDDLLVYDIPSGEPRATLSLGGGDLRLASLAPDGSTVLARTFGGPLVVWSLDALDRPARELADHVQRQTGRVGQGYGIALPTPRPKDLD